MRHLLTLTLLFLLACGSSDTNQVTPTGLETYSCGTQWCVDVLVNDRLTSCIWDSAANGQVWFSDELADDAGLDILWSYDTANRYGPGEVTVNMREEVEVCIWRMQENGNDAQECQRIYPYSTQINGASCLWGLN
jgi:hypothetical protein